MVFLTEEIKQLEKYIVKGAAPRHFIELLKKIKTEVDNSTIDDKENYQRLLKILNFLFVSYITSPPKKNKKTRDGDLHYINKKQD